MKYLFAYFNQKKIWQKIVFFSLYPALSIDPVCLSENYDYYDYTKLIRKKSGWIQLFVNKINICNLHSSWTLTRSVGITFIHICILLCFIILKDRWAHNTFYSKKTQKICVFFKFHNTQNTPINYYVHYII